MDRTVPVYVNRRSGMAHLDRHCRALELVPDGALRIAHVQTSSLPPLRFCRYCVPSSLPDWEMPLHEGEPVSRPQGRPPSGVDTGSPSCGCASSRAGALAGHAGGLLS